MKMLYLIINLLLLSYSLSARHTKEEWKSRSIYQILTDRFASTDDKIVECANLRDYCGGTFKGVIQHLDYIAGMGFDAIWISPPLKNKEGSFHGYHNIDLYSINEHFGTKDELKQLIDECHKRDIWVILDAVPNHMAGDLDISTFIPFNKAEHYHSLTDADCNGHWSEQTYKERCRIFGMPDLDQDNEYVKQTLIDWLKMMLNDYGFDGIRYADVPNVHKEFWGEFTQAAQTYTLGIVGVENGNEADVNYIVPYQDYMDGVGDYPLFYNLRSALCNRNMETLDNYIQNLQILYKGPQYNGIWLGNHDKHRFLHDCESSYKRRALRNGIAFIFFFEGIPMFYYGDEQYFNGGDDPYNREILFNNYNTQSDIYQMIKIMNSVRKLYKIYDYDYMRRYADKHYYVFTRGRVLIAICDGTPTVTTITLRKHGFQENDKLCNELDRSDCVTVTSNEITITMKGEPKVYVQYYNKAYGLFMSLWLIALVLFYI